MQIVVPQRADPGGYLATVSGGSVTAAPDAGRLTVAPDPSSDVVEVHVTRA